MKAHVFDNFLPDAAAERERALASTYEDIVHNKLNYRGISFTEPGEEFDRLAKLILGDGATTGTRKVFYRRYLESEESETYIHVDSDIAEWSAVLFLSEPKDCQGGIAFWRHRLYGWDRSPTVEELTPRGLRDTPELWKSLYSDGFDEFKWEMVDYVPMAFNRLVIFSSHSFHSRYPKRAFGTELGNARLIKTYFYQP